MRFHTFLHPVFHWVQIKCFVNVYLRQVHLRSCALSVFALSGAGSADRLRLYFFIDRVSLCRDMEAK